LIKIPGIEGNRGILENYELNSKQHPNDEFKKKLFVYKRPTLMVSSKK